MPTFTTKSNQMLFRKKITFYISKQKEKYCYMVVTRHILCHLPVTPKQFNYKAHNIQRMYLFSIKRPKHTVRQATYVTDHLYCADLASIKTEVKGEVKADLEGDTSKKSLMTTSMDKVNDGAVDAEVKVKKEPGTGSSTPSSQVKTEDKEGKEAGKKPSAEKPRLGISEAVRKEMERIVAENRRIQDLATTVHQKNHEITLKVHCFDTRGHCEVSASERSGNRL